MGSPEYVESQRRLVRIGMHKFMEEIGPKTHAAIDEWETEMQFKPMRIVSIHIYAEGFSQSDWDLTGVHNLQSVQALQAAIRKSVEDSGDRKIAVIPEGPYVIPVFGSE